MASRPGQELEAGKAFYTVILLSTFVGVGLDFVGINPVKALYWTAIINGLLAPFLLIAILVVASDKKLMQVNRVHAWDGPLWRLPQWQYWLQA